MRRAAPTLLLLLALAMPAGAEEAPRVALRAGSHADHGRIVFDWPSQVGYRVEEQDGRAVIRFAAPARLDLAGARRPPRNVLGVEQEEDAVVIRLAPGARLRHFRLGNRIVVDALDAAPDRAATPPAAAAEAPPAAPAQGPAARREAARNRPAANDAAPAPQAAQRPAAAQPAAARPAATPPADAQAAPAQPASARPAAPPAAASAPASRRATAGAAPVPPPSTPAPDATPVAAPLPAATPPAATPPATGARPAATPTPAPAPQPPAPPRQPVDAPAPAPRPAPPQDARSAVAALPAPANATLRALPGGAIAIAAGADSGLAAFRRGEWVHVAIDRPLVLDTASLRGHPVFAGIEARAAGDGVALRVHMPAPTRIEARREGETWILTPTRDAAPADAPALRVQPESGPPARLVLTGGEAGGTVALTDPETGETFLAATLRNAGPGIVQGRRLPEFDLLPTMLGAVVLARSDNLAIRALPEGRFAVQAAGGGSIRLGNVAGRDVTPAAAAMSRLLELPSGSVPVLLERMRQQLVSLNGAPSLTRGHLRRDAAETLLSLGMPQEAQAMAGLGLQEDPRARDDARLLLAHGVAALLSGRLAETRHLEDARLPATDEVALWRALLGMARGQDAGAALAAVAPLVATYPDALRDRVLPLVAEALAGGGEPRAAAALLADAEGAPGLDLARAMLAEAEGKRAEALAGYAAVTGGRDRRQRAAAMRRSAELRLAAGEIDAAAAATALEQSLFAWRDPAEEVATRRRAAALRLQAGQGPQAYTLLDETSRLFPDRAAEIRPELADAFAAALETAPPLAAATLFDAHPDLIPTGARGEAAVLLLADRLVALDLTERASAMLRRAMEAPGAQGARPSIGARLAALRAAEGDAAGALAALDGSESPGIEPALAERRAHLRARALARRGQRPEAIEVLAALGPAGAAARAELHAEAQDWPAALAAMNEHIAIRLPAAPAALAREDRVALARAAAFAALAGDETALAALREAHGERMRGGALSEAFAALTSDPLRGLADLPRVQQEIGMLRLLPSRLEALRAPVQVAR